MLLGRQDAFCLRGMRREQIHQRGRQTIVRFKLQFLQALADSLHLLGLGSGLDHRGHEGGKARSLPATCLEQLRMNEIQTDVPVVIEKSKTMTVAIQGAV